MLGLIAFLILKHEDCTKYYIVYCHETDVTNEEMEEALAIGLVVGGSILIPHLRRALEAWDELVGK